MEFVSKLKALSDANRLAILKLLLGKRYCVRALAKKLAITEAAVSQHMRVLKNTGFLIGKKRGYFMHYEVDRTKLRDLAREIESLLDSPSDSESQIPDHQCQCRSTNCSKSGCCQKPKGNGNEHD